MKFLADLLERFVPTMTKTSAQTESLLPLTRPINSNGITSNPTTTASTDFKNNFDDDDDQDFDDDDFVDDDDDDDDDDYYSILYNNEETSHVNYTNIVNEKNVIWETEDEFANHVYEQVKSHHMCDIPRPCDFYYDMFKTTQHDPYLNEDVEVFWLPKTHPYAMMIRESNIEHFRKHKTNKYPIFAQYLNVVLYTDQFVDQAVCCCLEICRRLKYDIAEDIAHETLATDDNDTCITYVQNDNNNNVTVDDDDDDGGDQRPDDVNKESD